MLRIWDEDLHSPCLRAFESWKYLNSFTSIIEMPAAWFMPYTRPDLQAAAQRLIDIEKELAVWSKMTGEFDQWARESGYPLRRMVFCKAPFDTIGDTLRGTKGIIRDMFRRPEQLLEAIDAVADFTIRQAITAANASRRTLRVFPCTKEPTVSCRRNSLKSSTGHPSRKLWKRLPGGNPFGTVRGRNLRLKTGNGQRISERRSGLVFRQDRHG